jgi:signal transduction histidine kinase/CheY-like chemotaxis protein
MSEPSHRATDSLTSSLTAERDAVASVETFSSLGKAVIAGWASFTVIDAAFGQRPVTVTVELAVVLASVAAVLLAQRRALSVQAATRWIAASTTAGLVVGSWFSGAQQAIGWWFLATVPLFVAHLASSRESLTWSALSVLATIAAVTNPLGARPEFIPSLLDKILGGTILVTVCASLAWLARRRMDRALAELDRVSRARSDLLASISHEIRTPLHGILGLATVLDEADLSAEQRELVRALKNSGRALNRIVDDVLDMARVDAGMVSITAKPTDLFAVIEDVIDLFAADASSKGVALVTVAEGIEHFLVEADEDRFRQVLSNLVRNALKFTESGSVVVRASGSRDAQRSTIVVRVEDTGPGLTDAQIDRLFERFSQPNPELARAHGGAGLGLALARDLVARMGGTLSAERARPLGACFIVELSLAATNRASLAPECTARVLIVEPEPLFAEAVESIARDAGPHITVARSIDRALEQCAEHTFDAVIVGQSPAIHDVRDRLAKLQPKSTRFVAATSVNAGALSRAAHAFDRVVVRPLRRSRVCEATSELAAQATPTPGSSRARSARALVVDDDSANRRLLARLLDARGWQCVATEKGSDAIDAIDAQPFDVVLCDLHMANMNGIELLRAARARGHQTPFVVVTASVLDEDRRRCEQAGFQHFLRKPFEPRDLDDILVAVVGAEPSRAPPPAAHRNEAHANPEAQTLLSEEKFAALADFLGPELDVAVSEFVAEAARYVETLCDDRRDAEDRKRAVHNLGSSALAMGLMAVGDASRALEARWSTTATATQLDEARRIRDLFERSRAVLDATRAHRTSSA